MGLGGSSQKNAGEGGDGRVLPHLQVTVEVRKRGWTRERGGMKEEIKAGGTRQMDDMTGYEMQCSIM